MQYLWGCGSRGCISLVIPILLSIIKSVLNLTNLSHGRQEESLRYCIIKKILILYHIVKNL